MAFLTNLENIRITGSTDFIYLFGNGKSFHFTQWRNKKWLNKNTIVVVVYSTSNFYGWR